MALGACGDRAHDRGEAKYRGRDTRAATLFECPPTLPSPFPPSLPFSPRSFTSLAWEFGWTVVRPSTSCIPAVLWLGRAFVTTIGFRRFDHYVSVHIFQSREREMTCVWCSLGHNAHECSACMGPRSAFRPFGPSRASWFRLALVWK